MNHSEWLTGTCHVYYDRELIVMIPQPLVINTVILSEAVPYVLTYFTLLYFTLRYCILPTLQRSIV